MSIEFTLEANFDYSHADYTSIFENSDATGFQSPVWLTNLSTVLAPSLDMEPIAVTLRDGGKLLGVVPLVRRKLKGLSVVESTDAGVSDYAAPVIGLDTQKRLEADIETSAKFKSALGSFDLIRIRPVLPEHAGIWKSLVGDDPKELEFSAHAVALTRPHEDWRTANVEKSIRSMMVRKGKRWKKQHEVVVERLEDPQEAKAAIAELAKMRAGRFEGDPIQQPEVCEFYAKVAEEAAVSGEGETWRIRSDGETATVVFGLTHEGQFLYLLIGADYDGFGRHSPGLVAYDHIMDDWSSRGGEVFDFTIGDEPFKAKFGAKAKRMSTFLSANSLKGRLALTIFEKNLIR